MTGARDHGIAQSGCKGGLTAMRVAVSGTHGSGKTTLVEDFVAAHPAYAWEAEPYVVLSEAGIAFSDPPTVEDYREQLGHSLATLRDDARPDVVFDRCPIDFLAYLAVVARGDPDGPFDLDSILDDVREAVATLDLIVFLPLPGGGAMAAEHPRLQRAVDRELRSILAEDTLSLFDEGATRIAVIRGGPEQRLARLEHLVRRLPASRAGDG